MFPNIQRGARTRISLTFTIPFSFGFLSGCIDEKEKGRVREKAIG
jgi:hypothetical protein